MEDTSGRAPTPRLRARPPAQRRRARRLRRGRLRGARTDARRLIAKADGICRAAHAQTNQLISKIKALAPTLLLGGTAAAPSAPGLVAKLHTVAAADLARLRALAQPSADHAAVAKFLDPLASVVSALGKALADLRAGHAIDAAALFSDAIPTAQAVRSAASAYGLKDCPSLLAALS